MRIVKDGKADWQILEQLLCRRIHLECLLELLEQTQMLLSLMRSTEISGRKTLFRKIGLKLCEDPKKTESF